MRQKPTPLPPSSTPIDLTLRHIVNGLTWRPNPDSTVANTDLVGSLVTTFAIAPHAAVNAMVTYNRQEAALQRTELCSWLSNTYTGHIVLWSAAFAHELALPEAQAVLLEQTKMALELIRLDIP